MLVVVLHVIFLCPEHTGLDAGLREELDEGVVLRQSLVGAEEQEVALFLVVFIFAGNQPFGLCQQLCGKGALHADELLNQRLVLFIHLVFALRHGTADDERRTGIVDEYGVHLVDDGIIMLALYKVLGLHGHVVAQVVKTEFVVGSEGDVGIICRTAFSAVGAVLVDAVHTQAVKLVKGTHPFRVTFGQIVVDSHHMYATACQCAEEDGAGGHQRLSFARCHFGNLSLCEHHAAEELYVVVYHIPQCVVASGHPMVVVDGFGAVLRNLHEILGQGQFLVIVCRGNFQRFVFREASCRVLHDSEGLGQGFVKGLVEPFEDFLLQTVNLVEYHFAVFDGRFFNLFLQVGNLRLLFANGALNLLTEFQCPCAEFVVAEILQRFLCSLTLLHPRLYFLHVAGEFAAENGRYDAFEIHALL